MHDDLSFLRAICHQPDDDALRLVYADWLDEQGDPRAEYLRLVVELRQLPKRASKRKTALQKQLGSLQSRLDTNWVGLLGWISSQPAQTRCDLVFLKEGKGLIEVRGGTQEVALLVEGKPVALNWDDCQGSVGQYLVFTGHTCGSEYVRQLSRFVAGAIEEDRPLADQIMPLLDLFVPGIYCLLYTPSTAAWEIATLEYAHPSSTNQELIGYYPLDMNYDDQHNLVCTQPRASLHEERVAYFVEQIQAGQRPIVLTTSATDAMCAFVIDGHHKLEAYNRQRVKPAILGIYRWKAPVIRLKEGIRFLPPGHPGISEYRRMKDWSEKQQ